MEARSEQERPFRQTASQRAVRGITGLLLVVSALLVSTVLGLPKSTPAGIPGSAYFEFDYPPSTEHFVFQLDDPQKIDQARRMLSGQLPPRHIGGKIVKQPAPYNPPWSYHLDPDSIVFFDQAIEICDASIQGVEDHLEEACGAFLPGCVWCPWGSRLLAEVTPQTPGSPDPSPAFTLTLTKTLLPSPQASATPTLTRPTPRDRLFLPAVLRLDSRVR